MNQSSPSQIIACEGRIALTLIMESDCRPSRKVLAASIIKSIPKYSCSLANFQHANRREKNKNKTKIIKT
jgi:hypothetical protein